MASGHLGVVFGRTAGGDQDLNRGIDYLQLAEGQIAAKVPCHSVGQATEVDKEAQDAQKLALALADMGCSCWSLMRAIQSRVSPGPTDFG
jgi:hypothetical protein